MTNDLFRIVYCSRNRVHGSAETIERELSDILTKSRFNNARAGITGALLYSEGSFAQVLEGPLAAIERTFEVIQRDPRHGEVTVVQIGPIAERQFGEWSMGFAGQPSADSGADTRLAFHAVFADDENGKAKILSILQDLVVNEAEFLLQSA